MFEHSIKVPRLYKIAAKILQEAKEKGISIKQLVYQCRHRNIKGIYALVAETLKHFSEIDSLIKESKLLEENRFDPWLARILITELLWGVKNLPSNNDSKPIKTILSYRDVLEKCREKIDSQSDTKIVNKVQKPRFVRINTLAVTIEEAINGFQEEGWQLARFTNRNYSEYVTKTAALEPDDFMIDLHIKELLLFPFNTHFYKHQAYKMGSIILQDKASCLPSHLLNPTPGCSVLDMCAAPGMKTTHLAALINNEGTVYAVEKDEKRFETLNGIIENAGATCVKTINKDVLKVTADDCPNVEYILVDPSCSGSGMTDRIVANDEDATDLRRLEKLSGFQILILKHALTHFPQAKRVVYSTCSIYPQENEYVVDEVLKNNTSFKLISAKDLLNSPWENSSENSQWDYITEKCLRTNPEKDLTNGFFIAVFERDESKNQDNLRDRKRKSCKKVEENLVPFEDELEISNTDDVQSEKKKLKKCKKNSTYNSQESNENLEKIHKTEQECSNYEDENEENTAIIEDGDTRHDHIENDGVNLISKMKKHKKRKKELSEDPTTEDFHNENENYSNSISFSEKKHKKKRKATVEEVSEITENDESLIPKNKKINVEDPELSFKINSENSKNKNEEITENDSNLLPKKKKKKRKQVETSADSENNVENDKTQKEEEIKVTDNNPDLVIKKKKKRKTEKISTENEEFGTTGNDFDLVSKKKKKKRKLEGTSTDSQNIAESTKIKKKKKEKINENEAIDTYETKEVERETKKSKKQKKRECELSAEQMN